MTIVLLAVAVLLAVVLFVTSARRPAFGCAVLAIAVPLMAGLGRGTVIPLLRLSEAMLVLVALGALVHGLNRPRQVRFTTLDLAVVGLTVGGVIIPAGVLTLTNAGGDVTVWQAVLAPVQYLVIYLLFSRSGVSGRDLRLVLNLTMAASVVVAVIGLAQLAGVPFVREFLAAYYPIGGNTGTIFCQFGVCRPTSLLEHWSSYGAYAVLHLALAMALVSTSGSGFDRRWLGVVIAINLVAVLASQTQAAVVGVVLVVVVVAVHRRRLPRQLLPAVAALAIGAIVFWPQVQARLSQQLSPPGSSGITTPESLDTRARYWSEFFLPLVQEHPWFGTGTVIPTDVPARLVNYVDNEYLGMGFRAGLVGDALLVTALATIVITGWRNRGPGVTGALASAAVAYAGALAVMGLTAEYLTYAGIAQAFWMIVGLLGAAELSRSNMPGRQRVILAEHASQQPALGRPA